MVYKYTFQLQVTAIKDRFGNFVNYNYSDGNLVSIESNDGRRISINYSVNKFGNKRISSVNASDKTWYYHYIDANHYLNIDKLVRVTLPDGRSWDYSGLEAINWYGGDAIKGTQRDYHYTVDYGQWGGAWEELYLIDEQQCIDKSSWPAKSTFIMHPNGSKLELTFKPTRFGRTGVPNIVSDMQFLTHANDICFATNALVEKRLYLDGSAKLWRYSYSQNKGGWNANTYGEKDYPEPLVGLYTKPVNYDLKDLRSTTVIAPDGSKSVHVFSRNWDYLDGREVLSEIYDRDGVSILKTTERTFANVKTGGSVDMQSYAGKEFGIAYDFDNRHIHEGYVNLISETLREYNNNALINEYIFSHSDYNAFGVSERIVKSNGTKELIEITSYYHDTSNWLLNLPIASFRSEDSFNAGNPYRSTVYNSLSQPYQEKLFGQVIKTHSYHADGNLFKTTYNGSNRYEQFEDYYRGKARKITLPCPTTNGCNTANGSTTNTVVALLEVNADGTTKSVTDFNGNKTSYSYNPIGWLTKIDYADPKWVDKVISYATVATADDGISGSGVAVGSLRQTITQGNFESMVYHDGLLRPVFTRTRDEADTGTISYQRNEYDHENRVTLASFPSSDPANRLGMATEYDALGRVVTQTRTSDNAITHTAYLAGNKIAVTDPMNNTTTTTFLAYGEPAYDKPTLIEAPNTDDVVIDYNLYDQITSIRQGNITESRFYDDYQQLCKSVRPETGITAYGYNAQRQPIWRALATSGSTISCDATAVPAADKVILAYNNQGVLESENFPDTTPDETYTYDPNGNLTRLQAGSIIWNYEYNSQNAIDKETLSLDGKSFVLDWEYNSLGAVSALKYPSGVLIDYAPNALGQPTKAGTYASAVKYHPNGQIKQFTYGNGIVRNVALDSTGRIDAITDSKTAVLLSLDPSYDDNDNLARLIDWVDRTNDVDNLSYDGVNRLLTADGRWGTGRYSYDGLGNVLSRSLNNSTINYQYDGLNRLQKLSGAYAYGYQYDSRGNVTNNGRYVLAYNLGQQMTSAKGIGYLYDGHNRRVRKTENGLNSYSVYSQGGQLLHRVDEAGKKTDSIYLGKTIVAEVDDPGTATVSQPPTVTISVTDTLIGGVCPPKEECPAVVDVPAHLITWSSTSASSCSGSIKKYRNGVFMGSSAMGGISGAQTELKDGSMYNISISCTGSGGSKTATATASGDAGSSDM